MLFRKGVKWVGLLILAHIASMILFGMVCSDSVAYMAEYLPDKAVRFVFTYNIIFYTVFLFILSKTESSYVEYRKSIKTAMKEECFSVFKYFKTFMLREHLIKLGVFMAFQIPFVIFFSIWGISMIVPIIFEQFYYLDAGCYILTNSSILGWILNTILFGTIYTLVTLFVIFLTKRSIEKI